jgi:hypothetical protein
MKYRFSEDGCKLTVSGIIVDIVDGLGPLEISDDLSGISRYS